MSKKPILCLDFDGVVHSYSSGWKGARNIPDEPVPGALGFIKRATEHFTVAIFSSRSHQFGGRRAMRNYLRRKYFDVFYAENEPWTTQCVYETAFADPWCDECEYAAKFLVRQIKFPLFKPAAMIGFDDRVLTFDGNWPEPESLLGFKPWNRKNV